MSAAERSRPPSLGGDGQICSPPNWGGREHAGARDRARGRAAGRTAPGRARLGTATAGLRARRRGSTRCNPAATDSAAARGRGASGWAAQTAAWRAARRERAGLRRGPAQGRRSEKLRKMLVLRNCLQLRKISRFAAQRTIFRGPGGGRVGGLEPAGRTPSRSATIGARLHYREPHGRGRGWHAQLGAGTVGRGET